MVVIGQKRLYSCKIDALGQSGSIRAKVIVLGQKILYSGKSGCYRAKVVVFGKKVVVFAKNGYIRAKWL